MTSQTRYQAIPKEERKRIEAKILREPKFRALLILVILVPVISSRYVAEILVAKESSFVTHFAVDVGIAVCFSVLLALALFRPLLKREVEKERPYPAPETTVPGGRGSS